MSKNEVIAKTWISGQKSCTLIIEKGISKGIWSYWTVACSIRKETRRYPYPEIS